MPRSFICFLREQRVPTKSCNDFETCMAMEGQSPDCFQVYNMVIDAGQLLIELRRAYCSD